MVGRTVGQSGLGRPVLRDVGIELVFGLIADLMNTYMRDVSLRSYYKYEGIAK
jgi:preprotein translocase subunit SecF